MLLTPGSGNVFCGLPFALKTYGNNVFDMSIKAPCAVKIALGGNPKGTYGERNQLPMTRMGVAQVLWDTFRKAKDYMEAKESGENRMEEETASDDPGWCGAGAGGHLPKSKRIHGSKRIRRTSGIWCGHGGDDPGAEKGDSMQDSLYPA